MKYRKLRIAWSVTWGVLAVWLCVLWVRSYQQYEAVARNNGKGCTTILCSTGGTVQFVQDYMMNNNVGYVLPARKGEWLLTQTETKYPAAMFQWHGRLLGESKIVAPHWFLISVFAAIAIVPWLPLRFIVWATR